MLLALTGVGAATFERAPTELETVVFSCAAIIKSDWFRRGVATFNNPSELDLRETCEMCACVANHRYRSKCNQQARALLSRLGMAVSAL